MPYLVYRTSQSYIKVVKLKKEAVVSKSTKVYAKGRCYENEADLKTYYTKQSSRIYKVPYKTPVTFHYIANSPHFQI